MSNQNVQLPFPKLTLYFFFLYAFIHSFLHFTKLQSMPDQILSLGDRNGLSPHGDDIKQIITILITSLTSGEIQLTIGSKQREFKKSTRQVKILKLRVN